MPAFGEAALYPVIIDHCNFLLCNDECRRIGERIFNQVTADPDRAGQKWITTLIAITVLFFFCLFLITAFGFTAGGFDHFGTGNLFFYTCVVDK